MKEYINHLKHYSSQYYLLYSKYISESEWGNKETAEKYLEKYWLSQSEYNNIWQSTQNRIFINQETGLPKMVFSQEYKILPFRGGILFTEEDFKQLQRCMFDIGDKYFVITLLEVFLKNLHLG